MNCSVCGNPLSLQRVVFRCECGAITHAHCWDDHILKSHEPRFTAGVLSQDDEFEPDELDEENEEQLVLGIGQSEFH